MKKRTMLLAASLVAVVALSAANPCLAFGVKGRMNSVFVVGDQIFGGGQIALRSVSKGDVIALEINGRPVALLTPVYRGPRVADATPRIVFKRDERGFLHFAYVMYESENGPGRQVISFRITALSPGLATLPGYPAYGETLRLARR
jgi:hypothetical protein